MSKLVDRYPTRAEMKRAHRVAIDAGVVFDSHTMSREGYVSFIKDKKIVANYNIKIDRLRRRL